MKKRTFFVIIIFILSAACGIFYYYYYNFIEIVTDRYVVEYRPSVELYDAEVSEPESSCRPVKYASDSIAIKAESKKYTQYMELIKKELDNALAELSEDDGDLKRIVKYNACLVLAGEKRYVICFSHNRSFDKKDFKKLLNKKGLTMEKVRSYAKERDIDIKIYYI